MSKKVVIIICALVAFFLGAIWVDYVPVIAPLVAFLELGIGFAAGFLVCKDAANDEFIKYKEEVKSLKQAYEAIKAERNEIKEIEKAIVTVKKTRKPKTTKNKGE